MKAVEFAFWLQGYFEISGGTPELSGDQLRTISKKAETVKAENSPAEQSAKSYVDYLRGALSLLPEGGPVDTGMAKNISANLQGKLNDLFVHAIDPSIQGDQQRFRDIHRPGSRPRPDVEVLC